MNILITSYNELEHDTEENNLLCHSSARFNQKMAKIMKMAEIVRNTATITGLNMKENDDNL